jgi:hypothetical protein
MIPANLEAPASGFNLPGEVQEKPARVSHSTVERILGRKRKKNMNHKQHEILR